MYRKNKFLLILVFVCLSLDLFLTSIADADGCIFIPTVDQWMVSYEEKQIGIINYENGRERLTLVIDIKNSSLNANEAFWLFPVPGNKNIDIDGFVEKFGTKLNVSHPLSILKKEGMGT